MPRLTSLPCGSDGDKYSVFSAKGFHVLTSGSGQEVVCAHIHKPTQDDGRTRVTLMILLRAAEVYLA